MFRFQNVPFYYFGQGSIIELNSIILKRKKSLSEYSLFFIDEYFSKSELLNKLTVNSADKIIFVDSQREPSTSDINDKVVFSRTSGVRPPALDSGNEVFSWTFVIKAKIKHWPDFRFIRDMQVRSEPV